MINNKVLYIKIVIFILGLLIVISACSDSARPNPFAKISGRVVDSLNHPIPAAKIFPVFYFDPPLYERNYKNQDFVLIKNDPGEPPEPSTEIKNIYPNPFQNYVNVNFYINKPDSFDLFINDRNNNLVKYLFEDELLDPGFHCFAWDSKNEDGKYLVNGVYTVDLTSDTTNSTCEMFLNRDYDINTEVENHVCNIFADNQGKFEKPKLLFPFGDSLLYTDESGELIDTTKVSTYFKLWAFSEGYIPGYADSIFVDPNNGCFVEIKLQKK